MRVLILGGTTEASMLAHRLAGRADIAVTLSLAGRTLDPLAQPVPTRIGGFGGPDGLARYLREARIDVVVDATHPFAVRISANAAIAARRTGTPIAAFTRPAWAPIAGDRWIDVPDNEAAARALGPSPRRVLLTIGRLALSAFRTAPQHRYVIRTIDPPDPADLPPAHRLILDRGPFDRIAEERLMREAGIDVVVTKNSGGAATYGKVEAARVLGIPVVMVIPPAPEDVTRFHDADAVTAFLEAHRPPP